MEEKTCGNCKHFARHYTISNTQILSLCYGHCKKKKFITEQKKEISEDQKSCDFWTSAEQKEKEQKKCIENVLRDTENSLRKIRCILELQAPRK